MKLILTLLMFCTSVFAGLEKGFIRSSEIEMKVFDLKNTEGLEYLVDKKAYLCFVRNASDNHSLTSISCENLKLGYEKIRDYLNN